MSKNFYDKNGKRAGYSRESWLFPGITNYYDKNGKKTGSSVDRSALDNMWSSNTGDITFKKMDPEEIAEKKRKTRIETKATITVLIIAVVCIAYGFISFYLDYLASQDVYYQVTHHGDTEFNMATTTVFFVGVGIITRYIARVLSLGVTKVGDNNDKMTTTLLLIAVFVIYLGLGGPVTGGAIGTVIYAVVYYITRVD